jgi:hypothetical protein
MPIILATQEAEIRKIIVRRQPEQIVCEILSQKKNHNPWLVEWLKVKTLNSGLHIYMYNMSLGWERLLEEEYLTESSSMSRKEVTRQVRGRRATQAK